MGTWRQVLEVAMTDEDVARLTAVSRSRTEPASRVQRAQMLLAYRENPSFFAVGQRVGVHHQTVQRCIERALAYGPWMALDDRPRPGKEPTITPEAKAWLASLACDKAKDHGYPHELWTTRLLARHAREHGTAAGHGCLANLVQGTVCKILGQEEIKPHKVRYYLERRDAEFEQKMAERTSRRCQAPAANPAMWSRLPAHRQGPRPTNTQEEENKLRSIPQRELAKQANRHVVRRAQKYVWNIDDRELEFVRKHMSVDAHIDRDFFSGQPNTGPLPKEARI